MLNSGHPQNRRMTERGFTMLSAESYARIREKEILVVDEDPWTREALAVFFSVEGIRCTALGSIDKGIEAVRKGKFDVIVCEHWLEGANGLWFLKYADAALPDALKVLITSYPTAEIRAEAERNPSIFLLPKPFRIEALESMLERWFAERSRRAGAGRPSSARREKTRAAGPHSPAA
ncbi:MAG TPA: response regulator, partial [Candidatus Aquicultoraceae bacterium]|nr:response regulator [Candidatus Aquicultoraceae bacterium]